MVYVTIRILEDGFDFYPIWGDIVIVLWIGACIVGIIGYYKCYQDIEQGRFYVVTDELIGKEEGESYRGVPFLWAFSKAAKLEFYAYGAFFPISDNTSHSSDRFAVSDEDNYICSSVGDTFFLVINKKGKILFAYNTKTFEYHE